ncbi:hypothetical protein GW17_00028933 [Ensete ventricosum]|nr:hypothetical protein GW17_00028933 [Ensete ventricosum]
MVIMWQDNANFEDDGIPIEPFNLKQEREEGYFDANGNFVEYARQNEIKIIQALKRLKGTSTDKKGKMLDATKQIFDQLTEGAMKLMENGDYS